MNIDDNIEDEELVLSEEEIALQEIRNAIDHKEKRVDYGEEKFFLINYIEESSEILNKTVRITYFYNEYGGGEGAKVEIL